jgi:hypothetical protein
VPVALTPNVGAPGHVFISYVREDTTTVDILQEILEAAGVTVWRDTENLWPGQDWRLEIRRAITGGSFAFLACFSDNSAARQTTYQNEELIVAIEQMRQMPPGRPWLLPIRLADCDVPDFDLGAGRTLASLQRVDLFGDLWQTGTARLVAAVVRMLGQSVPALRADVGDLPLGQQVKQLLREPHRQIELEDLVARTGMSVREKIQDTELFPPIGQVRTDAAGLMVLAKRTVQYVSAARPLIETLVPGCTWGLPEHEPIWTRVMQDAVNAQPDAGSIRAVLTLARVPAMVALYAGGLAAFHRGQYGALRALAIDPRYRGSRDRPTPLLGAVGPNVVFEGIDVVPNLLLLEPNGEASPDAVQALLTGRTGRRYTPASDWLNDQIRPFFADLIVDDNEFNEQFDAFEVLLGVIATDLRDTGPPNYYAYPWFGSFTWRSRYETAPIEQALLDHLRTQGDSAPEVRAGLFGGSSERAVSAAEAFVEMSRTARASRW